LIWVVIEEDDEGKGKHFGGRAVVEIVAPQWKSDPFGRLAVVVSSNGCSRRNHSG
jgi:hypothetical protein